MTTVLAKDVKGSVERTDPAPVQVGRCSTGRSVTLYAHVFIVINRTRVEVEQTKIDLNTRQR